MKILDSAACSYDVRTQFSAGAALILTLFCMGAALVQYGAMKEQGFDSAHKKTEIYPASAVSPDRE